MSHPPEDSVLIIGAGIFGTSTAYHLAKTYDDPSLITVVDRTPTPPDGAASTDINKIIRADYSVPFYCDLAYEALDAWKTWPELSSFYHQSGWVMLDGKDSDLSERIRKVFRDRGHDPTADVPLDELDQRWKGCLRGTDVRSMKTAYWNSEAGWCEAAAATRSLMQAAQTMGVKCVEADVTGLLLGSSGVGAVRTRDGGLMSASKVVVAAGAWTSMLLCSMEDELCLSKEDRVERQAQAAGVCAVHYKMSGSGMDTLSDMPVVVYGEHGEIIPPPASKRLLKFTNAHGFTNMTTTPSGHEISVPPEQHQHVVPDRLKRETEDLMTSRVMPLFTRLCWDSRTPNQDWLLCRHPHGRLHNLYFALGGSFHSYKFLPTAGKYMINVLSGQGNGEEKDRAWAWKTKAPVGRGIHEKTVPKRDLKDLQSQVGTDNHLTNSP